MIIMLNGPFGVGKTSAAEMLVEKLENSMIYDPEEIGFMLRSIVTEDIKFPEEKTDDFQNIKLWKDLTVQVAEMLLKTYKKDLIIPMTIWNLDRFTYIRNGLKQMDENVFHFCLLAQPETISKRLQKRGDEYGSWPFQQIEKCLNSFESHLEVFHKVIYTDDLNEAEVFQCIMADITSNKEQAYGSS